MQPSFFEFSIQGGEKKYPSWLVHFIWLHNLITFSKKKSQSWQQKFPVSIMKLCNIHSFLKNPFLNCGHGYWEDAKICQRHHHSKNQNEQEIWLLSFWKMNCKLNFPLINFHGQGQGLFSPICLYFNFSPLWWKKNLLWNCATLKWHLLKFVLHQDSIWIFHKVLPINKRTFSKD